jgi:hypothetical protein
VVKTVVGPGPLGVHGVAVEKGTPFWRRLLTREYEADCSGLANAGELWYRFTQNGRPVGFECRRWRWHNKEVEITAFAGFAGEGGEQSVRTVQRIKAESRLTCVSSKFSSRGGNSFDANGHCNGGRWVVLLNGKPVTRDIPDTALPSHALSTFVSTLPFERGRAYDIIRIDEWEFQPSYGCQVVCLGPEMVGTECGDVQAYRFEQNEYGLRQMAFWYNQQRQLVRAEYAGLVAVLSTREQALADLPPAVQALANEP